MTEASDALRNAYKSLRLGDRRAARRWAELSLKLDASLEDGWLILAALSSPQASQAYLERALQINPHSSRARAGLEWATARLAGDMRPMSGLFPASNDHAGNSAAAPACPEQLRPLFAQVSPPPPLPQAASPPRLSRWRVARQSIAGIASRSSLERVAKYASIRLLTLALTVVVGVFLAILVINYGGFVDQIFRSDIENALMGMEMGMGRMSIEERKPILQQAQWDMEEAYGLHQPFLIRCLGWFGRGLALNWGEAERSTSLDGRSTNVRLIILERFPATLLLFASANLLIFFASVWTALRASRHYDSWFDRGLAALSPLSSAPSWVHGILLVIIFTVQLRLLPYGGMFDDIPPETTWGYIPVLLRHLILPVLAIFFSTFFQGVYTWRTFFLIHAGEDYVEMARAIGLPERSVERRYVIRPAMPYLITSFALVLITLWQGSIALEYFFDWPGIGSLTMRSIIRLDRPVFVGLIVIYAYLLALTVFLLDFFYALVDPRLRLGEGGSEAHLAERPGRSPLRSPFRRSWRAAAHTRPPLIWQPRAWLRQFPNRVFAFLRQAGHFVGRALRGFGSVLYEIGRYPSALLGLAVILALVAAAIYTVVVIPPAQAIEWWNNFERWDRLPSNAMPEWVNVFRRQDLPPNIVLRAGDPAVSRQVIVHAENLREILTTFTFEYPYSTLPQDLALFFTDRYEKKRPHVTLTWITPDGQAKEIDSFSVTPSNYVYRISIDRDASIVEGMHDMSRLQVLFVPESGPAQVRQGRYTLQVSGMIFEDAADLQVEMQLYGLVYGLTGTDYHRRDLTLALMWGLPVALVFGLLGAVLTSLLSMIIAAAGAWYGGWVDGLIQRITEIDMILPALPLAIMVYYTYAKSVWVILGVMVLLNVFGSAIKNYRAVYLQTLSAPYIEAARAYGASDGRIILHYLTPRLLPMLIPQLVILVPGFVFLEATLAYMGVSDINLPTWGKVIYDALTNGAFQGYYYWVLEPVTLLLLTGLAFALLGFALDRIFNPRLADA